MTMLSKEMAVIGLITNRAKKNGINNVSFTLGEVLSYNDYLDRVSGIGVLNDFSPSSLEELLDSMYPVIYKVGNRYVLRYSFRSISELVSWLTYVLDPRINYPVPILKETCILVS